jgi:hypothetical protein
VHSRSRLDILRRISQSSPCKEPSHEPHHIDPP